MDGSQHGPDLSEPTLLPCQIEDNAIQWNLHHGQGEKRRWNLPEERHREHGPGKQKMANPYVP